VDITPYQVIYDAVYHRSYHEHLKALIGLGVDPKEAARRATKEAEEDAHRVALEQTRQSSPARRADSV
jgi:hypothetical protein